jgi:hypothetical protein
MKGVIFELPFLKRSQNYRFTPREKILRILNFQFSEFHCPYGFKQLKSAALIAENRRLT